MSNTAQSLLLQGFFVLCLLLVVNALLFSSHLSELFNAHFIASHGLTFLLLHLTSLFHHIQLFWNRLRSQIRIFLVLVLVYLLYIDLRCRWWVVGMMNSFTLHTIYSTIVQQSIKKPRRIEEVSIQELHETYKQQKSTSSQQGVGHSVPQNQRNSSSFSSSLHQQTENPPFTAMHQDNRNFPSARMPQQSTLPSLQRDSFRQPSPINHKNKVEAPSTQLVVRKSADAAQLPLAEELDISNDVEKLDDIIFPSHPTATDTMMEEEDVDTNGDVPCYNNNGQRAKRHLDFSVLLEEESQKDDGSGIYPSSNPYQQEEDEVAERLRKRRRQVLTPVRIKSANDLNILNQHLLPTNLMIGNTTTNSAIKRNPRPILKRKQNELQWSEEEKRDFKNSILDSISLKKRKITNETASSVSFVGTTINQKENIAPSFPVSAGNFTAVPSSTTSTQAAFSFAAPSTTTVGDKSLTGVKSAGEKTGVTIIPTSTLPTPPNLLASILADAKANDVPNTFTFAPPTAAAPSSLSTAKETTLSTTTTSFTAPTTSSTTPGFTFGALPPSNPTSAVTTSSEKDSTSSLAPFSNASSGAGVTLPAPSPSSSSSPLQGKKPPIIPTKDATSAVTIPFGIAFGAKGASNLTSAAKNSASNAANPSSTFVFGAAPANPSTVPAPTTASSTPFVFGGGAGSVAANNTANTAAAVAPSTTAAPFTFGAGGAIPRNPINPSANPAAAPFTFNAGASNPANPTTTSANPATAPFTFGAGGAPTPSPFNANLMPTIPPAANPTAAPFTFGAGTNQTTNLTTTTTASAPFTFGAGSNPSTTTTASAPFTFGAGANPTTNPPTTASASAPFVFGAAPTNTTSTPLFGAPTTGTNLTTMPTTANPFGANNTTTNLPAANNNTQSQPFVFGGGGMGSGSAFPGAAPTNTTAATNPFASNASAGGFLGGNTAGTMGAGMGGLGMSNNATSNPFGGGGLGGTSGGMFGGNNNNLAAAANNPFAANVSPTGTKTAPAPNPFATNTTTAAPTTSTFGGFGNTFGGGNNSIAATNPFGNNTNNAVATNPFSNNNTLGGGLGGGGGMFGGNNNNNMTGSTLNTPFGGVGGGGLGGGASNPFGGANNNNSAPASQPFAFGGVGGNTMGGGGNPFGAANAPTASGIGSNPFGAPTAGVGGGLGGGLGVGAGPAFGSPNSSNPFANNTAQSNTTGGLFGGNNNTAPTAFNAGGGMGNMGGAGASQPFAFGGNTAPSSGPSLFNAGTNSNLPRTNSFRGRSNRSRK